MRRASRWIPALAWMGFIFFFSSQPSVGSLPTADYVLHFNAYLVLGALYWWAAAPSFDWSWQSRLLILWLAAATYGISDEIHQSFIPGRDASVTDVLADAAGAFVALLLLTHPRLGFFRACLLRKERTTKG